jgi:hypothetical protein
MKAAAASCGGEAAGPCWGTTILASQRYSVASSGATIQFDPTDPQYNYVPNGAKVALAIAQLDPTVAAFLVAGLKWDQQNTNGQFLPLIEPLAAIANFTYPGNLTPIVIQDPNAGGNRRSDIVTGTPWCGTELINFNDTSTIETGFATFGTVEYYNFSGNVKPAYKASNSWPSTPFNGANGTANPYLVVTLNGSTLSWNSATWPTENCTGAGQVCSGSIQIDPIPYTQPGAYYDVNNNLVGPQVNPFSLNVTDLYSDPTHAGQWATRTVGGVQQWGTFTTPVTILGVTVYQYVKQM